MSKKVDFIHNRMDVIGKSYMLRGTVQIIVFCAVLIWIGDIAWTIFAMVISAAVLIMLYDVRQCRRLAEDWFRMTCVKVEKIKGIYIKCLPVLLYCR